jgi:hypothetical protein
MRAQKLGQLFQPFARHPMVIFTSGVLCHAGRRRVGVGVRRVVIVEHHHNGPGIGSYLLGLLAPRRLAVEIAHRARVPFGQPLIQCLSVGARTRVGNAAGQEAQLLRPRLDRIAETHGHPVATLALEPGSASVMMSRAPRP